MRSEQTRTKSAAPAELASRASLAPPDPRAAAALPAVGAGWEDRLYSGLRMRSVPSELSASLIEALGEAGVEAEHLQMLVHGFLHSRAASRQLGDHFLRRLDASARRLAHIADRLEVATQGYLTALEIADAGVREAAAREDIWWPEQASAPSNAEQLELRLRRCGFAYRHVVAAHLAANVEAVVDYAAQLPHALGALPPAGIVPAGSLYRGLDELTSALQGYVIPNHVADLSDQAPGLLTGIARLYALDAYDDTSIESDIVWARAQLAFAHNVQERFSAGRIGSAGTGADWAGSAIAEWTETIAVLEGLRATTSRTNTP